MTAQRRKELLEAIAFDMKNDPQCWNHLIVNRFEDLDKYDLAVILMLLDLNALKVSKMDDYLDMMNLTSDRLKLYAQGIE